MNAHMNNKIKIKQKQKQKQRWYPLILGRKLKALLQSTKLSVFDISRNLIFIQHNVNSLHNHNDK
jgi:hypothetical protein